MIGIYKFTNKYNRKSYIGKSTNIHKRYLTHLNRAEKGIEGYFYNALRKYGKSGFDFEILIECPEENLDYWEKFYIKYYGSNLHDYGYNKTEGGTGGNPGEEANKKISNTLKEYYRINGNPNSGRHPTEKARKNLSEAHKHPWTEKQWESYYRRKELGLTKLSEKSKKNQSEAQKRRWEKNPHQRDGYHWYYDETINKRVYYKSE